jgi:putative transposase
LTCFRNFLHLIVESIARRSTMRGTKAEELCRRHGISGTTFYKWKAKLGGLDVSEARRLEALENENRRLKKLLAEQILDNAALKDLLGKNF